MTESTKSERIQEAARNFMQRVGKLERPVVGKIANLLEGKTTKGINILMRAVGEAIFEYQDTSIKRGFQRAGRKVAAIK